MCSFSGIKVYIIKIFSNCSFYYIYKDQLSQSPPEIRNRYLQYYETDRRNIQRSILSIYTN